MINKHDIVIFRTTHFIRLSPILGNMKWRTNRDELGAELTFDIAEGENLPENPCKIGDMVILYYKKQLLKGVIVEEERNDSHTVSYKVFDYGFYLNKSNATYQFKKNRADKCIQHILDSFGIYAGNIPRMNVKIDKIYKEKKVSSILQDILDKVNAHTGKQYFMEMRGSLFYVDEPQKIKSYFYLYGGTFDSAYHVSNPTHSRSIADMRNAIRVYNEDDELLYTERDESAIDDYGVLKETVKLDKDEKKSAKTVAKNKIKELSRISEDSSVVLQGNDNVRSNRILNIQEPHTGIVGDYLVTSSEHTIENGFYTMSLDLEAVE